MTKFSLDDVYAFEGYLKAKHPVRVGGHHTRSGSAMCEAREGLRRDPGRIVPLIDTCLDALEAGRPEAAQDALGRLVRRIGESPTHGRNDGSTTTRKGSTTR